MNDTPTPNNWRPIETAPKDIPILGSDQFGVLSVLTWKDCSNSHLPRMAWSSHYDNEYMHHVESFPTHWQSLPEPPIPTPRTDDFTKTAAREERNNMNEELLNKLIEYIDARITEQSEDARDSSDGGLLESIRRRDIEKELRNLVTPL